MAYQPDNLSLIAGKIDTPRKMRMWQLDDTAASTTIDNIGYITDAELRGMQIGDIVFHRDTDASPYAIQIMTVVAIDATTGAADLSDGVAITATNT